MNWTVDGVLGLVVTLPSDSSILDLKLLHILFAGQPLRCFQNHGADSALLCYFLSSKFWIAFPEIY